MAINQFPYTNFHEANADWLLQTVKEAQGNASQSALAAEASADAAEAALAAASSALDDVHTAITNSTAALANADLALTVANAANTAAQSAVTTADTAASDASTAVSRANSAVNTANAASTVANQADATASAANASLSTNTLLPTWLHNGTPSAAIPNQMQLAYPARLFFSIGASQGSGVYAVSCAQATKTVLHDYVDKQIPIVAVIETDESEGAQVHVTQYLQMIFVDRIDNLSTDDNIYGFMGARVDDQWNIIRYWLYAVENSSGTGLAGYLLEDNT